VIEGSGSQGCDFALI